MKRVLTEEEKKEIVRLYVDDKYSIPMIQDKFDITSYMVKAVLNELGVQARNFSESAKIAWRNNRNNLAKEKTPEWKPKKIHDLGKLKALYQANWCLENIAIEFSTDVEEVKRCLERLKKS